MATERSRHRNHGVPRVPAQRTGQDRAADQTARETPPLSLLHAGTWHPNRPRTRNGASRPSPTPRADDHAERAEKSSSDRRSAAGLHRGHLMWLIAIPFIIEMTVAILSTKITRTALTDCVTDVFISEPRPSHGPRAVLESRPHPCSVLFS